MELKDTEYLDLKIDPLATKLDIKDFETKLVQQSNFNSIMIGVITVAVVAVGVFSQWVLNR